MASANSANVNFDDAARTLFAQLGLDTDGAGQKGFGRSLYNPLDCIWRDKTTGGKVYVGNQQAAQNAALLEREGITHIVNCTDNMPFFHQNKFKYYRFNVTFWNQFAQTSESLAKFLQPMYDFVDACVAAGENVMVHCLAGAHRAGTTGIILLMYKAGLSAMAAIAAAKRLRPVIDPIGRFPELLRQVEGLQDEKRRLLKGKAADAAKS